MKNKKAVIALVFVSLLSLLCLDTVQSAEIDLTATSGVIIDSPSDLLDAIEKGVNINTVHIQIASSDRNSKNLKCHTSDSNTTKEKIKLKTSEINYLISRANQFNDRELTSQESLELRKKLVLELNNLVALHLSGADTIEDIIAAVKVLFQSQAYLAEWKALLSKEALDGNEYHKVIQYANDAISARQKASIIAESLGWKTAAVKQNSCIRWPASMAKKAELYIVDQINNLEVISNQQDSDINALGEKNAYTIEGIATRKKYIKTLGIIENKWLTIGNLEKNKETAFLRYTREAELNTIQAKMMLDLGLYIEAKEYANTAIECRLAASHLANILGWVQDFILQRECLSWPSSLIDRANQHIQ